MFASVGQKPLIQEKWEVLLGVRLLGNTFWCGLSNHQAASAQMRLVGKNIAECRPPLGALPLSLTILAKVYFAITYYNMQHYTMLYYTTLYYTVIYCTILCCATGRRFAPAWGSVGGSDGGCDFGVRASRRSDIYIYIYIYICTHT